MTESQRRGDDVRRRLAAAEADLARERATVDRWVAWNEEQERVRRTEARNPPRSDVGGRYRSRVPERDDYADDDGYGYDIEYGQMRRLLGPRWASLELVIVSGRCSRTSSYSPALSRVYD